MWCIFICSSPWLTFDIIEMLYDILQINTFILVLMLIFTIATLWINIGSLGVTRLPYALTYNSLLNTRMTVIYNLALFPPLYYSPRPIYYELIVKFKCLGNEYLNL